jgi:hypothetical protein
MVTVRPAQRWTIRHLWIGGDLAIGLYIIGLYPSVHCAVTDFELDGSVSICPELPSGPRVPPFGAILFDTSPILPLGDLFQPFLDLPVLP